MRASPQDSSLQAHLRHRLPATGSRPLPRSNVITNVNCCTYWSGLARRRFMSVAAVLGPAALIARRLPGYEARPQQLDMAEAVADGHRRTRPSHGRGRHRSRQESLPIWFPPSRRRPRTRTIASSSRRTPSACKNSSSRRTCPFSRRVMPQHFTATLVKGRSATTSACAACAAPSRGPAAC